MRKLHNDISEGLSYLHANDLLHTDIKPENILVCGKDKRISIIKQKLIEYNPITYNPVNNVIREGLNTV